jgi:uncharacterized membrane protein
MTTLTVPRRFISLVVIATAVCVVLAAVTSVGAVDIIFGLPLAFVLPGAALVWAVDPWRRQVTGAERAMWSVGSSIGIVILGGLLLNLTGGLTRPHWLIVTSVVVAACALVGWSRGGNRVGEARSAGDSERQDRTRWVTSLSFRPVALLLAAVLVVSGALVLSQRTSGESGQEHFVQAWILPHPSGDVFSKSAQLGVRNEEGRAEALVIVVRVGSSQASSTTVDLKDGQEWTERIGRNPGQPVSATVALTSQSSSILDRVDLAKPS